MVDGVEVSLFEGDGLLVATQVSIIQYDTHPHRYYLIDTHYREAAVDTPWLQALSHFPTFDFSNFDQNLIVIGGSTGGPLVHPSLSAIVITPLACLASKPLVPSAWLSLL